MPGLFDSEFWTGSKGKVKTAKATSPLQDQLLELIRQGLETGEGPFADIFGKFDENAFNQGVRNPAVKNLKENTLPGILEKYVGGGQRGGSALRNSLTKAGTDLESQLAGLMYQGQQQQQQNKLQGLGLGLGTKQVDNLYQPGTEGALQGFVRGAAPGLAKAGGGLINSAVKAVVG